MPAESGEESNGCDLFTVIFFNGFVAGAMDDAAINPFLPSGKITLYKFPAAASGRSNVFSSRKEKFELMAVSSAYNFAFFTVLIHVFKLATGANDLTGSLSADFTKYNGS